MEDRQHASLSLVRQCALPGVSRSSLYYRSWAASAEDLSLTGLFLQPETQGSGRCWPGQPGERIRPPPTRVTIAGCRLAETEPIMMSRFIYS